MNQNYTILVALKTLKSAKVLLNNISWNSYLKKKYKSCFWPIFVHQLTVQWCHWPHQSLGPLGRHDYFDGREAFQYHESTGGLSLGPNYFDGTGDVLCRCLQL